MSNKTIIAGVLFSSLVCSSFASAAQSVRDKAVKAAYQGPEARVLNVFGKRFNVKKAKLRLGPGTRVVDGQIAHVHPFLTNAGIRVSYTMVFRRDGTLIDVSTRGVSSTGVYDAITKQTATKKLVDGSWRGAARYLIAEIGRGVPRDLVGTPIPLGETQFPGQTLPSEGGVMDGGEDNYEGDVMDGDQGNYEDEVMDGDEGNYEQEGDVVLGDEGNYEEGDATEVEQNPPSYFLGVSTSRVLLSGGHGQGQYIRKGQQRFSGDSYGLRINSVVPGSPAQRAGLENGDIVISANQKPMNQLDSLTRAVAESNGQLNLILRNVRNGHSVAAVVKLDAQTSTFRGPKTRQRRK